MIVSATSKMTESPDKTIQIDEASNTITVTDFTLSDPDVVEYFVSQDPQQLEERLKAVIQTGVLALKSTDITTRVDYVRKEFAQLKHDMDTKIEDAINSMDNYFNPEGSVPTIMEKYLGNDGEVNRILDQYVGENGNMRTVISNMMSSWTAELQESMDPNNENGLLSNLKQDIIERLEEIKRNIAYSEGVESMKSKSTAKGVEFEDVCYDMISDIAHIQDDGVSNVSKEIGLVSNSKSGDILVEIAKSKARIAIEIRNVASITQNQIKDDLDAAIRNRGAHFGLCILNNVESVKKSMSWFHEFDSGDKLAIALSSTSDAVVLHEELLLIAYKWARAKALENIQSRGDIDTGMLTARMNEVREQIQKLSTIKTQVRNIENATVSIKDTIAEVTESVTATLDSVSDAFQKHEK